jgi:hypothetical protein
MAAIILLLVQIEIGWSHKRMEEIPSGRLHPGGYPMDIPAGHYNASQCFATTPGGKNPGLAITRMIIKIRRTRNLKGESQSISPYTGPSPSVRTHTHQVGKKQQPSQSFERVGISIKTFAP